MAKVIICREEAVKQIDQFKDQWGYEDPQSIATGGKDSAFPEQAMNVVLASVMTGRTEFAEGGKKIIHQLKTPVKELTQVILNPASMKQHERRELDECTTEQEIANRLLEKFGGIGVLQISEMSGKDVDVLTALAMMMLFI